MGSRRQKGDPGAGDRAPDLRLRDLAGNERTLDELRAGGPVLLVFFKVTCPVCQLELPFLERVHREAANALKVCAVSQDDAEWTRDFYRRYELTFTTLIDPAGERYPVSNAYGIAVVPTAFLIERDGTISWKLEGFNKREIQALAGRFGVNPFRPGEFVPEAKAG